MGGTKSNQMAVKRSKKVIIFMWIWSFGLKVRKVKLGCGPEPKGPEMIDDTFWSERAVFSLAKKILTNNMYLGAGEMDESHINKSKNQSGAVFDLTKLRVGRNWPNLTPQGVSKWLRV